MSAAFVCAGVRSPIGRYGGGLSGVRPDDLAARCLAALCDALPAGTSEAIDDIVLGCANQAGEDNRNVARMAGLLAGLPVSTGGVTVNRLCASGLEAVATAARAIAAGDAAMMIAGGVESMSRAPYVLGKAAGAFERSQRLEDTTIGWRMVNPAMASAFGVETMPETAENVAAEFAIGRDDQDAFALRSQQRAAAAAAFHAGEIAAIRAGTLRQPVLISADEHPRTTSREALARLAPIVRPDGTVTAGNSSGVNDGAAALLLADRGAIDRYGLDPRARVLGMASAGVAPRVMGIGPVPATHKLLERIGWTIGSIDLIELNEAFAAQALAVLRQLGLPDDADHVNPHGGAIALGHPLGMSGARLVLTAIRALEASGARRALVTMCVGVGQGAALALERV
jgi:3-oxoadipyl-CoA thiolase